MSGEFKGERRDAEPDRTPPLIVTGWRRGLYLVLGLFFVGLGLLGAFLPVLPTTPFLILASYFFVRSSPALHRRLLRSPLFGPMLRDWDTHRGVRPHVKVLVAVMLPVVVASSMYFGNLPPRVAVMLFCLGLFGLTVVRRLKTVRYTPAPAAVPPPAVADEPVTSPAWRDPAPSDPGSPPASHSARS